MSKKDVIELARPDREAVYWHNLLSSGEPTEEQLVAHIQWLRASERHESAMGDTEATWDLLDDLQHDADIRPLIDSAKAWPGISAPATRYKQRRWLGVAAALVLAVAALFTLLPPAKQVLATGRYVTALGEQETHSLADGTRMILNTSTEVELHYTDQQRQIRLKRGEALFDIAPDPARPFTVVTDYGVTQALGTVFNVYIRDDGVQVSLLEGKVEVSTGSAGKVLSAGEQVSYMPDGTVSELQQLDAGQVLLWTQRKLNFNGVSLMDAVAEINRYSAKKLVVADPEINDITINLRLSIDNLDSFYEVSEELFGVKAEERFGRILLSRIAR